MHPHASRRRTDCPRSQRIDRAAAGLSSSGKKEQNALSSVGSSPRALLRRIDMRDVLPRSPVKVSSPGKDQVSSSGIGHDSFLLTHARTLPRRTCEGVNRERRGLSDEGASAVSNSDYHVDQQAVLMQHAKEIPRPSSGAVRREARGLASISPVDEQTGAEGVHSRFEGAPWPASPFEDDGSSPGPGSCDEADLLETPPQSRAVTPSPEERPRAPTPEWLSKAAETVTSLPASPCRPHMDASPSDEAAAVPVPLYVDAAAAAAATPHDATSPSFEATKDGLHVASHSDNMSDDDQLGSAAEDRDDEPEWLSKAGVETGWISHAAAREEALRKLAAEPLNSAHALLSLSLYLLITMVWLR